MWRMNMYFRTYFLPKNPHLKHYSDIVSDIVSDIPSGSFYGVYILTFYLTSFWYLFWQSIWHEFWHSLCLGRAGTEVEKRRRGGGWEEEGVAPLLTSRDPHLAGGQICYPPIELQHPPVLKHGLLENHSRIEMNFSVPVRICPASHVSF